MLYIKNMIAIIIPTKSNLEMFFKCLTSIQKFTSIDYKLYIADTGSDILEKTQMSIFLENNFKNFKMIEYDYYHFAKINNDIVKKHVSEEILLFMNNDIQLVNNLIDILFYTFAHIKQNKIDIGTLGCRLIFPNNLIQHDSQIVIRHPFIANQYGVSHQNFNKPKDTIEYNNLREVLGNTFACCMTEKHTFEKFNMLNEQYIHCFEDLEYNLICYKNNYKNIILPSKYFAIHHESFSRKQQSKMTDKKDYLTLKKVLDEMDR